MPAIKFNYLTKEIELQGSEPFIEANFYRVQNLRSEMSGVKKMIVASETSQEPLPAENQSQAGLDLAVKRAPVRKYIRKAGLPGQQRVVEAVEEKPKEISIASLREKFGLSASKVRGILRDA